MMGPAKFKTLLEGYEWNSIAKDHARREKDVLNEVNKQAKDQIEKFISNAQPAVSKFKSIVDQYEKFGLRKGEIKEQLEYIQAKQEQLKTLLNWAER